MIQQQKHKKYLEHNNINKVECKLILFVIFPCMCFDNNINKVECKFFIYV